MKVGFPKFTPSAKKGEAGISIVSRIVDEEFSWLFRRNHQERDFGIDGQIEVVSDEGAVTGQMLACQIKCGESFFRESNKWGYVYRGQTKHFNYLANYPVPVIIVVCDPKSKEAYWVQFRPAGTQITGVGWRLTIPYDNKLAASKQELLSLLPTLTDHLTPLKDYWRVNNIFFESEAILFLADVKEVNAMDVSRAGEFWQRLTSSRELAHHCQGKIEIGFSGYDDDPRELFEIEKVRQYVALLDDCFSELFFFVRTQEPASTLKLFIFSLMNYSWKGGRATPGRPQQVVVDLERMPAFLNKHFVGLNLISEWLALPAEENRRITNAVARVIGYTPE